MLTGDEVLPKEDAALKDSEFAGVELAAEEVATEFAFELAAEEVAAEFADEEVAAVGFTFWLVFFALLLDKPVIAYSIKKAANMYKIYAIGCK